MRCQRAHNSPWAAARGARTLTRRNVTASGPTYCVELCSLEGASFVSVAGCVWTLGNGSSAGGGAAVAEKHLLSCTPRRSAAHGSAERAKPPAQRVSAQQRQRARALHTHRGCCASPQGHAARCGRAGVTQPQLAARSPRRAAAARRLERTSAKLSSGAALRGPGLRTPVRCLGHHAHAMTIQPDVPQTATRAPCLLL